MNKSHFKTTPLRWNKFAGLGFHITLDIEFNIYFEKGKFNKTPTVASKMKFSYFK
jgi:hypothetical protein